MGYGTSGSSGTATTTTDLPIEQRACWVELSPWTIVEGHGRGRAAGLTVGLRIDDIKQVDVAFVLDPRPKRPLDRHVRHRHHLPRKESRRHLPLDPLQPERTISTDATSDSHGHRVAQLRLVEHVRSSRGLGASPDFARRSAEQTGVGRDVIVLVHERQQPHLDIVQRADAAEVIEATLAQRAPDPTLKRVGLSEHFSQARFVGSRGFRVHLRPENHSNTT